MPPDREYRQTSWQRAIARVIVDEFRRRERLGLYRPTLAELRRIFVPTATARRVSAALRRLDEEGVLPPLEPRPGPEAPTAAQVDAAIAEDRRARRTRYEGRGPTAPPEPDPIRTAIAEHRLRERRLKGDTPCD
jgi:hypothetical protein